MSACRISDGVWEVLRESSMEPQLANMSQRLGLELPVLYPLLHLRAAMLGLAVAARQRADNSFAAKVNSLLD